MTTRGMVLDLSKVPTRAYLRFPEIFAMVLGDLSERNEDSNNKNMVLLSTKMATRPSRSSNLGSWWIHCVVAEVGG